MTWSRSTRLGIAIVVAAAGCNAQPASREPSIPELIDHLEHRTCNFPLDLFEPCSETDLGRLMHYWLNGRNKYRCVWGAAVCLERLGPRAGAAVPALIHALRNGLDAGDGAIPARGAIAAALGAIGDPRAIDPLAKALKDLLPADRAKGSILFQERSARSEMIQALGSFGPAAARHSPAAVAVLRECNAKTSYRGESAPWGLDRLAKAAASALGRFGRPEAVPVLLETLRNPAAAEAAALGLAELGPRARAALPALRDLLEQPSLVRRVGRTRVYSNEASRRDRTKLAAVRAIERLGGTEPFEALVPFARDDDVGRDVCGALERLDPERGRALRRSVGGPR